MSSRRSLFVFTSLPWCSIRDNARGTDLNKSCFPSKKARTHCSCVLLLLLLVLSCLVLHERYNFSSTDHDFLSTNLTLFSMMTTFFSFLSAVLHLWIAILRPVMQSVSMNVAISLFIRLGHVEGLGEEGWHDAVFVVCFSPFACALRTLFVAPIPSHRLFSW